MIWLPILETRSLLNKRKRLPFSGDYFGGDLQVELSKKAESLKSFAEKVGRFFFHVMASLTEKERELTVERTRAGLEVAKLLGRKGGRKANMTASKIESAKKLHILGSRSRLTI